MNELFNERVKNILTIAQREARSSYYATVGTEHILLGMVIEQNGLAGRTLRELGMTAENVRAAIEDIVGFPMNANNDNGQKGYAQYSPRAKQLLAYAGNEAKRFQMSKIGTEHVLLATMRQDKTVAIRVFEKLNINLADVQKKLLKYMGITENKSSKKRPQVQEGTPTLDSLARDLTQQAANDELDPVIGRHDEVERLIQILSRRTKNNPILVGEPGVGKTAIAEGLAQKIVTGQVPEDMQSKRLMMLDMGAVVAGTKYRGEFEDRMKNIINEIINDGNVIVFIDELHTLIGAGGAEGAIDASNILKPALARGELQLIGATTLAEYQKYIERDTAFERRFAPIQVGEPTLVESEQILLGLKPKYEEFHGVKITDDAIHQAVTLSDRYLTSRQLPDKAIDLMDEAAARVRLESSGDNLKLIDLQKELQQTVAAKDTAIIAKDFEQAANLRELEKEMQIKYDKLQKQYERKQRYAKEVTGENIATVLSQWTGVPTQQLEKKESERLLDLEKILHERLVGQDKAVKAVARAIRRARSGLKNPQRPIGSFMFLGPTGVGKTELAKALAESMFGSEDALIRVDMSEYMEKYSTSRLIGSAPGYVGYDEGGQLTEKVRQKPYSVILFDEVEKAHPDVFNILLQVLDDGYLTDAKGRHIDFKNTILIMTSNIGATALRDDKMVGFGAKSNFDEEMISSRILEEMKKLFRPEFINRIDEVVVFQALQKEELHEIVRIMSKDVTKRLLDMEMQVKITPAAIDVIAKAGFDPEYGARPIRRALQKEVEDRLSEAILSGQLQRGQKATLGASKGEIKLSIATSKVEPKPIEVLVKN